MVSISIIWTEYARIQLKEIYLYYKTEANQAIAQKIRKNIFSATRMK